MDTHTHTHAHTHCLYAHTHTGKGCVDASDLGSSPEKHGEKNGIWTGVCLSVCHACPEGETTRTTSGAGVSSASGLLSPGVDGNDSAEFLPAMGEKKRKSKRFSVIVLLFQSTPHQIDASAICSEKPTKKEKNETACFTCVQSTEEKTIPLNL